MVGPSLSQAEEEMLALIIKNGGWVFSTDFSTIGGDPIFRMRDRHARVLQVIPKHIMGGLLVGGYLFPADTVSDSGVRITGFHITGAGLTYEQEHPDSV